jgi:Glycosyltransferase Family 4/Glycosyl transferases group 1
LTDLVIDLRPVDPIRPDAAGEYALQLTEALVGLAVHAEIRVLEPGFKGPLPAATNLLLPAGGSPSPSHRCIVAVHELAPLRSGLFGFSRRFGTAFAASRSARVIAPSEAVSEALQRYLRVPAERVVVVLPGLEPGFARSSRRQAEQARAEHGLPERYLLAFGDAELARRSWAGAETPAEGAGMVHVDALRPERQQLAALLSGAIGVLFCERLNGDSIRAVQAMACGAPPVVPDDGAYPEVVRDGGLTVRAGDLGDWSEAISALYRSSPLRMQLSARGRELAAGLTADAAARRVLGLLEF